MIAPFCCCVFERKKGGIRSALFGYSACKGIFAVGILLFYWFWFTVEGIIQRKFVTVYAILLIISIL